MLHRVHLARAGFELQRKEMFVKNIWSWNTDICMSNVLLIIRSTYCYKSVLHFACMVLNIILREFSTCVFRQIWASSYRFSMYNGSKYTHFKLDFNGLISLDSLWNSSLHFSNRLCELVMTFTLQWPFTVKLLLEEALVDLLQVYHAAFDIAMFYLLWIFVPFLSHLTQRVMWAIVTTERPSSVR